MVAALTLSAVTTAEAELIEAHYGRLTGHLEGNLLSEAYYRGTQRVRQLGIALPDHIAGRIETIVGWPEVGVNTLKQRVKLTGFSLPGEDLGSLGLDDVLAQNEYLAESRVATLDELIYGLTFAAVSDGDSDEPHPLVTWEPPTRMTAMWDHRKRRISSACGFSFGDDGQVERATLITDYWTVIVYQVVDRLAHRREWVLWDRRPNRYGEVAVVPFVNRRRSGRAWGSSEITPAWRSVTDSAVRTMLGMEVSREFHSSPQRYALNVSEDAFTDAEGNPVPAWEALLGRVWALSGGEDGVEAKVGQFNASSPAPYIDQVRGLSMQFSGYASLPPSRLGFHTDNPPSGDSMRMYEADLVMRAEDQQDSDGAGHAKIARLVLRRMHGEALPDLSRVVPLWRDPAIPTQAASADATVKGVAAGVLPPTSEVTWERFGLSADERARLSEDVRRDRAMQTIAAIRSIDPEAADLAGQRGDILTGG